jgi:predicted glycosyltransferase
MGTPFTRAVDQAVSGRPAPRTAAAHTPKILFYSHDTFGLGNIRRTLLLSATLAKEYPFGSLLLVTGSPVIQAFRIPNGLDYIKLPCLDRVAADVYRPKFLAEQATAISSIRQAILHRTVVDFEPDLFIVDKRPGGVGGELMDALRGLRRRRRATKLVLGIRDILDEPARTRASLKVTRDFPTIERYYDEVWIYGEQSVFDSVTEYAFPGQVARKTRFCGYLKRPTELSERNGGPPRVLVTTGGGEDGSELITAYLEGLVTLPRSVALQTTVIFGPQLSCGRRDNILAKFGDLTDVTFLDFVPDLTPHYAAADFVVSMAGYNTVCELLSFGRRAVLVPRTEPTTEQLVRARLLAERGFFDLLEPSDLTPGALIAKVLAGLRLVTTPYPSIGLDGLTRIRQRVRTLLTGPP